MKFGYKIKVLNNQIKNMIEVHPVIKNSPLTRVEGIVLGYIFNKDKPISQKSIQHEFSIGRSTSCETISSLENKGYIKQMDNLEDSRVKDIKITKEGKKEYRNFIKAFEEVDEYFLDCLSQNEKNQLEYLLTKLINNKEGKDEKTKEK